MISYCVKFNRGNGPEWVGPVGRREADWLSALLPNGEPWEMESFGEDDEPGPPSFPPARDLNAGIWCGVVNLTPHTIDLPGISIPPIGTVARVEEILTPTRSVVPSIELVKREYGKVQNLPNPMPGWIIIVSALVRLAKPDRYDLASPGELIRDGSGQVIGCKNLVINERRE